MCVWVCVTGYGWMAKKKGPKANLSGAPLFERENNQLGPPRQDPHTLPFSETTQRVYTSWYTRCKPAGSKGRMLSSVNFGHLSRGPCALSLSLFRRNFHFFIPLRVDLHFFHPDHLSRSETSSTTDDGMAHHCVRLFHTPLHLVTCGKLGLLG